MNRKVIIFGGGAALGIALGALFTYLIMHTRMEKEIEAQIEDVKRVYSVPKPVVVEEEDVETDEEEPEVEEKHEPLDITTARARAVENAQKKADIINMSTIIKRENYNIFSNPTPAAVEAEFGDEDDDEEDEYLSAVNSEAPSEGLADYPYVISDTDFIAGHRMHDQVTVNYYDDGIAEEALNPGCLFDDIDGTIGRESLEHFGEYEEDVVFVRNERLGIDYEVIRQHRTYAEIPGLDDVD